MAATTTLAQGSSVTLTVVATDTLLIDGARSASAIVEAVTGVPGAANRQRIVNHPGGQATYGPFGAGTVQLSAIGGAIAYAQGAATLDDEPQDVKYNQTSQSLVSGDGTNFYIGPTSDYEYPPTLVEITASQGVVGKSCGLLSVKCVAGSAIALTVYDNATTAAGTVLFSQTMSAGNAAVFPAPVQAINGVWAAFSGTATFEIEVQDVI